MMNWKTFFKEFVVGSPYDLKKLFPDYFNLLIIRAGSVFLLFLLLFTSYSNDWNFTFNYFDCPDDVDGCLIPQNTKIGVGSDGVILSPYGDVMLVGGECYGNCPNGLARNFARNMLFTLLFILCLNHLSFIGRTGKYYPKPDPTQLKKWKKSLEVKNE